MYNCKGVKIKKLFIIIAIFSYFVRAEVSPTILQCKCKQKTNRDYYSKEWSTSNDFIFRDKVFSGIDTNYPIIKSITPKDKHFEEQITEFQGVTALRTKDMIVIMWSNPFKNKLWTATIYKSNHTVTITENYQGLTSNGINVEVLNCK